MRILVAGVGNIFLGDDGFGPEVIAHVAPRLNAFEGVRVHDYGIGGIHLTYDLLDDWDVLVLVDALPDHGAPGGVRVFEAEDENPEPAAGLDVHSMDPGAVIAGVRALGATPPRTIVIGCQVADISDRMGLSPQLRAAVPRAVDAVVSTVAALRAEAAPAGRN